MAWNMATIRVFADKSRCQLYYLGSCLIIDAGLMVIECNYFAVHSVVFLSDGQLFFQCYPQAEYAMGKTMQTQQRQGNRHTQHSLSIGWVVYEMCNCWLALKILELQRGWKLSGLTSVSCFRDACLFE